MDNWTALDNIQIASPCGTSWESMDGDDRVRYCGACKLRVYNVEGLTKYELKRLLARNEGRLCLRLVRRTDGTLLTRDCPVGLRAIRRRLMRLVVGMAALLAAVILGTVFPRIGSSIRKADEPYGPLARLAEWMNRQLVPVKEPPAADFQASPDDANFVALGGIIRSTATPTPFPFQASGDNLSASSDASSDSEPTASDSTAAEMETR